jgi:hypothetical protein
VKGIQACFNKVPGPLQRGDNHKNVKIGLVSFKNGPILSVLGTNHPWSEGIQVCSYEGDSARV